MYQSPMIGGRNFTTSVAGTNTATSAPFVTELQNLNKDKERKKPKAASCPLHRKKDLNKLEECYWAQWKPSKTSGVDGKTSSMQSKYVDAPVALAVPRFPYIGRGSASGACENCQRLMQNQFLQKSRCQHCFRNFVTYFSSNTDYSDVRGDEERTRTSGTRYNQGAFDDTTDYDGKTTGWDSTDRYNGRSGPSTKRSDFGGKPIQTMDKSVGVCCACDGSIKSNCDDTPFETASESGSDARPLYVNKSCFTGSSEVLMRGDDEVPVRGSPRGSRPGSPKKLSHDRSREEDASKPEPVEYHCMPYDMEDECCGVSGGLASEASSHAQVELAHSPKATSPIPGSFACNCHAADVEEHEKNSNNHTGSQGTGLQQQQQDNRSSKSKRSEQHQPHLAGDDELFPFPPCQAPCSVKKLKPPRQPVKDHDEAVGSHTRSEPPPEPATNRDDQPVVICDCNDLADPDEPNNLFQQMKRLSKYIPAEAKELVKEMAKMITSEPIQEIKRQAEKILECALEADAGRSRKDELAKLDASQKQVHDSHKHLQSSVKSTPHQDTPKESRHAAPIDSSIHQKSSGGGSTLDGTVSPKPRLAAQMSGKLIDLSSQGSKECPCCPCACPCLSENPEINEGHLLQEQQRLKRQQEQLLVQEQLRRFQQQQMQHQLEDQRKLLEEQAKEIQRQRDLQKKQALLQQQEQQLREQAQAQAARMQQLDAASLRLRLSQELAKETVTAGALGQSARAEPSVQGKLSQDKGRKPLLSSAVARVTGALKHSYPLGKGSKKTSKLCKR